MSDARAGAARRATVRRVRRGDLDRLWELVEGLADYERLRPYLTGTKQKLGTLLFDDPTSGLRGIVADRDGALVGYALVYPVFSSFRTARVLWLEDLFVEPSARGSGAGAALMSEVARMAVESGCLRVDWFVLDWNALAIDFYERVGGRKVDADWLTYSLGGDALASLAAGAPGTTEPNVS